jgi:hypothetical protein
MVAPNQLFDPRKPADPVGEALRLLQVLEMRGRQAAEASQESFEHAQMLSFAEYTESFRQVQEFLSFCEVLEGRLEALDKATREMILTEVNGVKMRCYAAMLKAMGAYLTWMDRRGMVNFFAQAVFLSQIDALQFFREQVLPEIPPNLVPDYLAGLQQEVEAKLKKLLDSCVDVPDFRFEN